MPRIVELGYRRWNGYTAFFVSVEVSKKNRQPRVRYGYTAVSYVARQLRLNGDHGLAAAVERLPVFVADGALPERVVRVVEEVAERLGAAAVIEA